jgi:pimeloyl-ACP methyl ester carboxylesterase
MHPWHLDRTYQSASGKVRWSHLGDPARDPVVLLHGTPFSSFVWRDIAPALSRTHHVYVWDMPGYGASDKAEGQDLSLAALSRLFADLLHHWGLSDPAVIAHDSGGAVALGATLRDGASYRRLALVDAVALAPWGSPFFHLVGDHGDAYQQLPGPLHQALLREYVRSATSRGLRRAVLDTLVEPWLGEEGQRGFYRQLAQRLADEHYTDQIQSGYGSIDIPVLACWGEEDTWVPADHGRELAAHIPGAHFEPIPDAGHLVQEDNPAYLTAALLGFLQAQY